MPESFLKALDEAFDALVIQREQPKNNAIAIMMDFVFSKVDSAEDYAAMRKLVDEVAEKIINPKSYAEVNARRKTQWVLCYDQLGEETSCNLIATMMMFHNMGSGEVEMGLVEDSEGREVRAICLNWIVIAELYERENSYLARPVGVGK